MADDAAAVAHATELARDLVTSRFSSVPNWALCRLEVTDEAGRLVLDLPLITAMRRLNLH